MNKGLKTAIYAAMIGVAGYFGYTIYQFMKESDKGEKKKDTLDEDTQEELLEIADVKTQSDGTYLIGTINPDIYGLPDVISDIFDFQSEYSNNFIADKEINLSDDDAVDTTGYGQNNYDFIDVLNPEVGQSVQFSNAVVDLHIHNVNNFEYWFVINDINCTQGYGELNSFTLYSASNMEPLQPISLNSNVIGYQFLESEIVFVEIIIACKDNYDAYLDAITISFYLNVGGFIQEGGALPTINGVDLVVSPMPPISEEVITTQQN